MAIGKTTTRSAWGDSSDGRPTAGFLEACNLCRLLVKFHFVNWKKPWVKIKWQFPKMRVPPNHSLKNRVFHYKPSSYWGSPMTQETSKSIDLFGWLGTTFGDTNHDSWNPFLKFKTQGSADFFLSVYILYTQKYLCMHMSTKCLKICVLYIYMNIYIYDIYIYKNIYIYIKYIKNNSS
jgi:hypothetical protein